MSRNAKIALIVLGTLVVICLGVCGAGYFFFQQFGSQVANPDNAHRIGTEIADYTLPQGYVEQGGVDLLVYKMVFITSQGGNSRDSMVIMLMNTNAGGAANRDEMERQMQQSFQQQFNRNGGTTRVVGTEQVTIRGQETTLTIAESDASRPVKQVVGTFDGKNGLVILMVIGDKANWNDTLVKDFIASIQ